MGPVGDLLDCCFLFGNCICRSHVSKFYPNWPSGIVCFLSHGKVWLRMLGHTKPTNTPLKFSIAEKMMVGSWKTILSFWEGLFSGAMFNF